MFVNFSYVDELFDSGGKFDLQSLKVGIVEIFITTMLEIFLSMSCFKVMLKKKRLPTADMEMKLLLEGVFDEYGLVFITNKPFCQIGRLNFQSVENILKIRLRSLFGFEITLSE